MRSLTATRSTPVTHTDGRTVSAGIDASHPSSAAVLWAVAEAESTGRPIRLVSACEPLMVATPVAYVDDEVPTEPDVGDARRFLATTASRYATGLPHVEADVMVGGPVQVLLESAKDAYLVVVGQRGVGAVRRLVTGSTSIAVAGRAPCPTVVVPNGWSVAGQSTAPVVVGLDLRVDDLRVGDGAMPDHPRLDKAAAALDAAVDQADRRRVPLIVLSSWEAPREIVWTNEDVQDHETERVALLEEFLLPWRDTHPQVEIVLRAAVGPAEDALDDAARTAQLLVVARRTKPMRTGGFALGSSTRHLLHHLVCPLMVVP